MVLSAGKRWSREELILAFNLYCRTPFGRIHMENREVMALARALGRSPGAVSYKLVNFARLDPALQARGIRGMSHGAKGELEVWEEFATDGEALAYESEMLLARLERRDVEETIDTSDLEGVDGRERAAIVRVRVNQSYFRRMLLARYSNTCCVTGLRIPELLVASHIAPWADAPEHRMNPRNGLCLNALHDRAFDRGLLTVSDDLRVRVASVVRRSVAPAASELLARFDGASLTLPGRFTPDPALLAYHRDHVFRG